MEFLSKNEDLYIGYYYNNQVKSFSLFEKALREQLKEEYLKRKTKMGKDKNSAFSDLQIKTKKIKDSIKLKMPFRCKNLR